MLLMLIFLRRFFCFLVLASHTSVRIFTDHSPGDMVWGASVPLELPSLLLSELFSLLVFPLATAQLAYESSSFGASDTMGSKVDQHFDRIAGCQPSLFRCKRLGARDAHHPSQVSDSCLLSTLASTSSFDSRPVFDVRIVLFSH